MAARPAYLRVDSSSLEDLVNGLEDLSASQREKVLPWTLNALGNLANTQVKRTVATEMGIAVNRAASFLSVKRASPGRLQVAIVAKGPRLPLKDFKPMPAKVTRRRPPVGVSVIDRGARKVLPHTFIGPNVHVFKRVRGKVVMTKGRHKGRMRERIKKLWGPGVPLTLIHGASKGVVEKLVETDGARLVKAQYDRVLADVKKARNL